MIEGKGSKDFQKTRTMMYQDPKGFERLIHRLEDHIFTFLSAQIQAGVEVVQIFDSWCSMIPHTHFEEFAITPIQRIVKKLRQQFPLIPIIGFPKSAGTKLISYVDQVDVDAVSIDHGVDMKGIKTHSRKILQGNLDPLCLASDLDSTLRYADHLIKNMSPDPFIFNLGHGIVPNTPIAHVEALINHIRSNYHAR